MGKDLWLPPVLKNKLLNSPLHHKPHHCSTQQAFRGSSYSSLYIFIAQYVADTLEKHLKKLKCFLSQCLVLFFEYPLWISKYVCIQTWTYKYVCKLRHELCKCICCYIYVCVSLFSVPTHMCLVLNSYECINTLVFPLN